MESNKTRNRCQIISDLRQSEICCTFVVNGKPKMDVDMFFSRIRKELTELIK